MLMRLLYRFFEGSKNGELLAGFTNTGGRGKSELDNPTAVFVTRNQTMFIVDSKNFRVQKWNHGEPLGFTVAGGRGNGAQLNQISLSYGLYVDDKYNVYVSEYRNHRVTLWMNSNTTAGIIVSYVHG